MHYAPAASSTPPASLPLRHAPRSRELAPRRLELAELPALARWLRLDAASFQAELSALLAITRDRNRSLALRAAVTDAVHHLVNLRRELAG
ncbi:MAG: hypothetical protein U0002_06105 [Thermoanaerobaculia bacterium]